MMRNMGYEEGLLINDGMRFHKERFQQLIQAERLDELKEELFSLIDCGKLTWKDVYLHLHFIPGLLDDPNLEDVYYCCHVLEGGETRTLE